MANLRRLRVAQAANRIAVGGTAAEAAVSVTITGTATVAEGGTRQLTATVRNAAGSTISQGALPGGALVVWSSSHTAVATVNQSGLVTAVTGVYGGEVLITATVGHLSTTYKVTVTPNVTPATVTLTPTALTLANGARGQVAAVVRNAQSRVLLNAAGAWSSDQPSRVTVVAGGRLNRLTAGAAVIQFTTTVGSITAGTPLTVS
jgi:hypothetical protein